MKLTKLLRLSLISCCAYAVTWLPAQETEEEGEIETLSPFTVDGTGDVGYRSSNTLAGTRINTSLRDVASSISIVNREFIEDTGSTDLEDILIFTPNTEVAGLAGNFSGAQGFGAGNAIPELTRDQQQGGVTRVRGLAEADLTRDYFLTDIPFDSYNVERVEVQRGANSALFGLGSPGGIVNHSLRKADFLRNRGQVRLQTDQYSTVRASFNYNRVILEDKLSVFVAGLYEDQKYEQEQAFGEDERLYASVVYRPIENINIYGSFEWADRVEARPDPIPPNDGITPWILMGKPTFDTPGEAAEFFRGTGDIQPGIANNQFVTLVSPGTSSGFINFYNDSDPDPFFGGNSFVRSQRNPPNPGSSGELMFLRPRTFTNIIRRTGGLPNGVQVANSGFFSTGFVDRQITDRTIFDYREQLFTGGASSNNSDWTAYTIGSDGVFLDGRLGYEVAYYSQDFFEENYNNLQGLDARAIYIDPNRTLLATQDGSPNGVLIPNPTFGQPVMDSVFQGNNRVKDRTSLRASIYGEIRASDFIEEDTWTERMLGFMRLTASYTDREFEGREDFMRGKVDRRAVISAVGNGSDADINNVSYRHGSRYELPHDLSGNAIGITRLSDLQGANIQALPFGVSRNRPPDATYTSWSAANNSFVTFDANGYSLDTPELIDGALPASFSSSKSVDAVESQVLVGQWFLLDDGLVLFGSWRNDKASSGGVGAPGAPGWNRAELVTDPGFVAGVTTLTEDADEDQTSWGVTIHTPRFIREQLPMGTELSVYFSESENFQPSGGGVTVFNDPIPFLSGSTEEFGIIFSSLDGRLNARFNWYETGILNDTFDVGGVSASEGILLNLAFQLDNADNIAQGFTASDVQAVLPPAGVLAVNDYQPDFANATATTNRNSSDNGTQDFTSEGNEIEISFNPTPKWTMLLSLGRQETVTSNTYPVLQQYVNDFVIPTWVNSNFAQNYFIDDFSTTTLSQRAQETIVDPVTRALTQDGIPAIEQAEWRWNFNTAYNFGRDGALPDWAGDVTIGGGYRWQDEVGIGFGVGTNALGEPALDPNQPFFADAQSFVDIFIRSKWDVPMVNDESQLTVQVNIKDLFDQEGLIPFFSNPNGSELYRFSEGRLVTVSATLDF